MNPNGYFRRFAASLAFLFALAVSLDAQTVVYNNLVSSGNSVEGYGGILSLGQSFTPSASGTISSLTLNLTTTNGVATPTYNVELWSDNGGGTHLPSALLVTFVSGQSWLSLYSGSGTANAANTVTFPSASFNGNYSVNAGTEYWLVVHAFSSGSLKSWGIASATGDPIASSSNGTTWGSLSLSGDLGAQISVSGIPEPGTYAAFAGLAALIVAACTRRRVVPVKRCP